MKNLEKFQPFPYPAADRFPLYFKSKFEGSLQVVKVIKPGLQVYLKVLKKKSDQGDVLYEYQLNRIALSDMDWTYLVKWFNDSSEAEFMETIQEITGFCLRVEEKMKAASKPGIVKN